MATCVRWISALATTLLVACAVAEQPEGMLSRDLGTLITADYELSLRSECAEGEVSCAKVFAELTSVDNGNTRELRGSTLHSLCADGVSPCRFLGYQLSDREYDYRVLDNGQLHIQRCTEHGCESIYNEQGQWHF